MPDVTELSSLETWSFLHPLILNMGRVTYPAEMNDEERDLLKESDPQVDRLTSIGLAKPLNENFETAWQVRASGDFQAFNNGEEVVNYGSYVFKSYYWPGMTMVCNSKKFVNIYVGYGLKAGTEMVFPAQPRDINIDPVDGNEMHEPNPKDAPKKQEEEGEEKKEGEEGDEQKVQVEESEPDEY